VSSYSAGLREASLSDHLATLFCPTRRRNAPPYRVFVPHLYGPACNATLHHDVRTTRQRRGAEEPRLIDAVTVVKDQFESLDLAHLTQGRLLRGGAHASCVPIGQVHSQQPVGAVDGIDDGLHPPAGCDPRVFGLGRSSIFFGPGPVTCSIITVARGHFAPSMLHRLILLCAYCGWSRTRTAAADCS